MAKSKMDQARRLIQQKKYDEARAILLTVDDPRARQWLGQLDDKYPSKPRTNRLGSILATLLTIIISAVLTSALIGAMIAITTPMRAEQGTLRITQTAESLVAANATETATHMPQPTIVAGQVNATSNVNVRSEPDVNSAAIAALVPGTSVEILGTNDDNTWYQVRLSGGQEGWLAASLVNFQGEIPTAVAEVATATPEPVVECTPEIAQAWYDDNRQPLYRVHYLGLQLNGALEAGDSYDHASALQTLRTQRQAIESTDSPECLAPIRDQYLAAIQAFDNGFTNQINGFPNEARSEWTIAARTLNNADQALEDEYSIQTPVSGCGAEIWYTGIAAPINEFLMLTDGVTIETGASQEIRDRIFRLQDLRREVDVYVPDCSQQAALHLYSSFDAGIGFFQAVMNNNTPDKQAQLNAMVRERDAFFVEMNRLNVALIIQ